MAFVLSLDFGTGGVRAGVFDVAARRLVATAESAYPTRHIRPNRAEQDPLDWWHAAARAVRLALDAGGNPAIDALCVATFSSTVVLADRAGNPLCPAILWMDARASAEAELTGTVAHPVLAMSGGADAVEWLVPKAMWMARHRPDLWAQSDVCCEALDWVNFRLTGKWAGSRMIAICKWNYDPRTNRFSPDLFEAFGVPELAAKLPGEIVGIGRPLGRITEDAARQLGIRGEPIVMQGGIDAHMGIFGAAALDAGDMLLIGGTSNVFLMQVADDDAVIDGVWGPYPDAVVDGLRLVEAGQVSAGSVLTWLSDTIFGLDDRGRHALWKEAAAVDLVDTGLLALDYFMGNRTPYRDARLRGAVLGLSLSHDRASLYRAAVTSVALGAANIVTDLRRQGQHVGRLVVAGGMLRNALWLEATVDAMGLPVHLAEGENLTLHGCAAASALGLGLHPDVESAARAMQVASMPLHPDEARHARYVDLLADYREATELLEPILHRLSDAGKHSR